MTFAKNYKKFLILPGAFVLFSLVAILAWGLKPGIDLSGGTLLQVSYPGLRPDVAQIEQALTPINLGDIRVQPAGSNDYLIRMPAIDQNTKNQVEAALQKLGPLEEKQFTSISPTIGADLLRKAWAAIGLVVLCIIAFIAFAFRKVSQPVASWKYGVIAIVSLLHDVLIPVGLFALLGAYGGAEVDSLFIVALLTILGISINDKIVIFDRIRENLRLNQQTHKHEAFERTIEGSITQTLARSINTSLTVIVVLAVLFVLGPASTKDFALTLLIGMIAGTYSSIFLAAPLLVVWEKWSAARFATPKARLATVSDKKKK